MFLNPDAAQRTQIPGIRSIRFIEQYHVSSSHGLNEKINDHIQKAVNAFFSISGDDRDKKKIPNGVSSLISTALDGFIGSTSVGESESASKAERRNLPLGSHLDFAYDGAAKVWKPKLVGPDYSKAVIDSNRTVSSKPASIGDVQAYIEELIAVWKKLRDDQRQV